MILEGHIFSLNLHAVGVRDICRRILRSRYLAFEINALEQISYAEDISDELI